MEHFRLGHRSLGTLALAFFSSLLVRAVSAAPLWPPLPSFPPIPTDNPITVEKVQLGKQLFFDKRLSKDGTVSCNSCHSVMGGGTDNRAVSVGIYGQKGKRSAPTVWNAAFNSKQFWDGRAGSLEEQAKGPLTNPIEMGMESHAAVIVRLKKIPGYVTDFQKVFPGGDSLNIDNVAKAIATYERTLITPNSPYDRYAKGDKTAISAQAERGMQTAAEVGCMDCHGGGTFSAKGAFQTFPKYENNEYVTKYHFLDDKGKGDLTHKPEDDHVWKTATWRNVALTAPYFHNGSVKTLPEAIRVMAKTQLDITLTDQQVADIGEFLHTLTGEFPTQVMPLLPGTLGETLIED